MYGFDDELDYDLFPAFEAGEVIDVEPDSVTDTPAGPSMKDRISSGLSSAGATIKKIASAVRNKIKEFGAWLMNMARSIKDHLAEIFKKDVSAEDAKDDEKMLSALAKVQGLVLEMGDLAVDALLDITDDITAEELADAKKNDAFKKFGEAMSNKTEITSILGKMSHFNASYKICKKAHDGVTKLYGTNSNIGRVWSKLNNIRGNASGDRLKMINQFTKVYNSLVNCSYALYNKVRNGFKQFQEGAANAYKDADKISKKDYKSMTGDQVRAKMLAANVAAGAKDTAAYAQAAGATVEGDADVRTVLQSPIFRVAADKKGTAILKSMSSYAEKNNISATMLQQAWKKYVRQLHNEMMAPGSRISEKAATIAKNKTKPAAVVFATNAILARANRSDFIKTLNEMQSGSSIEGEA